MIYPLRCARRKRTISSRISLRSEIPLNSLPRTLRRSRRFSRFRRFRRSGALECVCFITGSSFLADFLEKKQNNKMYVQRNWVGLADTGMGLMRSGTHTILRLWLLIVLGAVAARASVSCCRSVAGFGRPCVDCSAAVLSEACQQEYKDTSPRFRACGAWREATVPTGNAPLFVGPTSPSRSSSWRAFAAGR